MSARSAEADGIHPRAGRLRADEDAETWRIWVDTGGTFTDCLAVTPTGDVRRAKVLSSSRMRTVVVDAANPEEVRIPIDESLPNHFYRGVELRMPGRESASRRVDGYDSRTGGLQLRRPLTTDLEPGTHVELVASLEAPLFAAHWVTRTPLTAPLPAIEMRLATTRGTNALLERKGSPTALFITSGFADLLEIGNQQRSDIFALSVSKRRPLYAAVVEVEERIDSGGTTIRPLDLEALQPAIEALLERDIRTAAVALMHSYRNPHHEAVLARHLERAGFRHVSVSSALAPRIKIVPRAETAVVNAYLAEVIGDYLKRVESVVAPGPLHVLTSAGSLTRAAGFDPKDSLLSGPAGGVVGAARVAIRSGFARSLAFDMGGTSTDVSRFEGDFDYRFETRVGDALLLSPALAIETVAAGGGSICRFAGDQLKVGPESAGASPGPACYGVNGPLTLTDVNLLLGRLNPASFEIPIDIEASRRALNRLYRQIRRRHPETRLDRDRILSGFLAIANERMAEAVRRISVRQGYRPSDYALVAFGGAGGQHACAVAGLLGIETILVPRDAGLLSAVGLGAAGIERIAEHQVLESLPAVEPELEELTAAVVSEARRAVTSEGVGAGDTEVRRVLVYLRLQGQESTLEVDYEAGLPLEESFMSHYQMAYGYRPVSPRIEVESIRAIVASRDQSREIVAPRREARPIPAGQNRLSFVGGRWRETPVYWRSDLDPGATGVGPALIFEDHCATLVDQGWRLEVDGAGALVLTRIEAESVQEIDS